MTTREVYLDANATTALDHRVLEAMLPHLHAAANASSAHRPGQAAARAVEQAREQIATLVGAHPREVVFTSGATEANNLAVKGAARGGPRRSVVSCTTEHKAVLEPLAALTRSGFDVTLVDVDGNGVIDVDALRDATGADTALVTVMAANNETGTLAPLPPITDAAHRYGALFHCDATQLLPWGPINVELLDVDLLSLSAHKMHGPQGVGALYVRRDLPWPITPLTEGGGQERGLRAGTLNTAGIVGLGAAAEIVHREASEYAPRVAALRDRLHRALTERVDGTALNGHPTHRAPGTLNLCFGTDLDGDALTAALPDVAVATGSACTSAVPAPSHVLLAMGRSPDEAGGSLRMSLSRLTTIEDVDYAAQRIAAVVTTARRRLDRVGGTT